MSAEQGQKRDLNSQLLDVVRHISLAADFHRAMAILLEEAAHLVPSDGTSAMWLKGDLLEIAATRGELVPLAGLTLPVGQVGCARPVLDSGRPLLLADTAIDARWHCTPGEEQVRAWLSAPLMLDSRAIGLLEWTAHEPETFKADDLETAAALGRYVAPILHRLQLLEDIRHRLREQDKPRARVPEPPDVSTKLQLLTREALDFTGARNAFAFTAEEGSSRLRCVAAAGDQRDRLKSVVLRGDGTLGGLGAPARRSSEGAGPGPSDREVMAGVGIVDPLILPLRAGKEQVGILGVAESRDGRRFGQDTIRLMTHLASQASLILEQAVQSRPSSDPYDYEMAFQSCPLGMCVLSITGEIQACNPALVALLSAFDHSLVGHSLSEFLLPEEWQRIGRALEEVALTGQRQQVDTTIQSGEGERRHVRLSLASAWSTPAPGDRNGQDQPLVAVVEDVTWLKILERERVEHLRALRQRHNQLQELDELRSRFVSNVSHELRTPLAVIKLYATLAQKGRPEKQRYYLQTIEQETHRLETMVENILDLTRIDRQTLRIDPEWLASEEIIAQVLEVYQETAHKRGIALKNQVIGRLPRLWADKNDLVQMLTNLVDNGLKYTPRGGQVWVAAKEVTSDGRPVLEIAVGDTGIGIPDNEQTKVFERFYRGSNNPAGSTGTGLGLAIVRELMAQHGGRITLQSRVGEGSVVTLQFPLAPAPGADTEGDLEK